MSQDIVFRRIRGRIVPIKLSKRQKEGAKGVGLTAAGVAVAAGSGHVAGKAIHAAAKAENVGRAFSQRAKDLRAAAHAPNAQMSFPGMNVKPKRKLFTPKVKSQVNAALHSSTSAHFKSEVFFKASRTVGKFGKIAGGVLIGSGLTKLYESATGKVAGLKEEIIANVAGQVATAAFDTGLASAVRTGGKLKKAIQLTLVPIVRAKLKL